MIDHDHALPVARQARLVGISRSSVYYVPRAIDKAELVLMRRIDELHLEHPFAGARMLARMLRREGFAVGRKHVGTLMKRMGIEASQVGSVCLLILRRVRDGAPVEIGAVGRLCATSSACVILSR